ncbi:MAG: amino acid aminotransferase [Candidatus Hydrogenedentota bacterium]
MFEALDMAPPDAIMGLSDGFNKDPDPNKINLTIGVYKDSSGKTPVLSSVKKAEERLLTEETTKAYVSIEGDRDYADCVQRLLFGESNPLLKSGVAVTADTPGGTGGLRVAAEFIHGVSPHASIWLSEPTWPNHQGIFNAAGLNVRHYPYYDAESKMLDFEAMKEALRQTSPGDVVLLHACCHNPTGLDPSPEQWAELATILTASKVLPFFDFAYQGLGDGLEQDAQGLRTFLAKSKELIVASSFSKNFGVYRDRVGAVTLVTSSPKAAETSMSHMKRVIRSNYSTPPAHGASIVKTVLNDPTLRLEWEKEVVAMCERIQSMRSAFVETLRAKGVKQDFSFLARQKGMFSFSGLTKHQVEELREKHSVYIVGNGRINVAGITPSNVGPLCDAVAAVLNR